MAYNVPSDVLRYIHDLEKRIIKLERAPRAGYTSIDSGTFKLVNPTTSNTVFYVGDLTNGDYGVEIYRDDGTIAIRIGRMLLSDPQQVLQIYNKVGDAIGGDQSLGSDGEYSYSTYAPIPATGNAQVGITSGSFVDINLFYLVGKASLVKLYFTAICTDGTTSGELRLTNSSGTALTGYLGAVVDPVAIPTGTTSETAFDTDTNTPPYGTVTEGTIYTIKAQARRTAGSGTMNIRPTFLLQRPA